MEELYKKRLLSQPRDGLLPHLLMEESSSVNRTYFIQCRNGQMFAKVDVSVAINRNPNDYVWIEFHGEANPNASRNFEADAAAMIPQ